MASVNLSRLSTTIASLEGAKISSRLPLAERARAFLHAGGFVGSHLAPDAKRCIRTFEHMAVGRLLLFIQPCSGNFSNFLFHARAELPRLCPVATRA